MSISFQIVDWYTENYDKRENENLKDGKDEYYDDEPSDNEESDSDNEGGYDSERDDSDSETVDSSYYKKYEDTSDYKIYIFGKDNNEKTYCVEVNEFTPYFYVRLPDFCSEKHRKIMENWVKDNMMPKHKNSLLRTTLLEKHSFRNFDNKKLYKYVRLVFRNTSAMRNAVGLFQNKQVNQSTNNITLTPKKLSIPGISPTPILFDLYENMIDPLLKFIHHRDIKPVGWIKINKTAYTLKKSEDKLSYCDYELTVKWSDIKYVEDPNNVKIKVLSYDIECTSSHGDFPLPIKDYTKLARDIFAFYMRVDTLKQKCISEPTSDNKQKIIELNNVLDNRERFAINSLISAFYQSDKELSIDDKKRLVENSSNFEFLLDYIKTNRNFDINKVYTKNNFIPTKAKLEGLGKKLSENLYLSTSANSNERKRENTRRITLINKLLNENLPELEGDTTIQIGMSFFKYGETNPYKNYMLTVDSCKKLDNAETLCFKTEKALLLKFRDIIIKEDPEIITGYNTDGFDTPWLFKRAKELEIYSDFSRIGRFINFESNLKEKQVKGPTGELIKKEHVEIPGRIQMDILPLVMKGYQLGSYKLDDVSAEFINGTIYEIEYDETSKNTYIYTDSLLGLNERNFIVINQINGYLENKFNDGEKFEIFDITKNVKKYFDENKKKNINLSKFSINKKIDLDIKSQKCMWCIGKDDVSPQDIFSLQKGTANDRYIIAKYCLMDVILCIELLKKLELITNSIGMANVCLNPLSWIIHRGQGVKILSLVAYFIKNKNYLLPYLYKDNADKDGYEGAVVLDPKPKIYLDDEPISVLDYGSLYPSSMREKNISHETIVTDPKYLGEEGINELDKLGYDYEDVSYDVFKTIYNSVGKPKQKIKIGVKTVRYVQYRDKTKGIIPQILEYLVNARKSTRNKISYKTVVTESGKTLIGLYNEEKKSIKTENGNVSLADETIVSVNETYTKFQQQVLDGLQLAFKITANSLYGQVGAKVSDIYYKELAASTTSVGRGCLMIAKEYVENEKNYPQILSDGRTVYLKNEVVYGDSCTGDTPIILNMNNNYNVLTFDDFNNDEWVEYNNFMPNEIGLTDKQMINMTERNVKIWTHNGWSKINKIIRHHTNKKIYRVLTHTGCVDVTEDHSLLDKDVNQIKPKDCNVGMELLHSFPDIKLIDTEIDKTDSNVLEFDNKLEAQNCYSKLYKLNYNIIITNENDKYQLTYSYDKLVDNPNIIKKIYLLHENYNDYVYDIETEEGVFHAGIGSMIIKNTDSVFVKFQCLDDNGNTLKGREARSKSIKLGMYTDAEIQRTKLKEPQVLEYEKTFHPFILFTKKRYVGNKYEFDPDEYKRVSMGIVLKRRDNAPIVKVIFGGIIDIIMKENNISTACTFLRRSLIDLTNGKFGMDALIISKTLSSYYKDPERIAHKVLADRIAERDPGNKPQINDRIPFIYVDTSKVKTKQKLLQGDKIELPSYVKQNNLKPDYEFYINRQIKNPVTQIFALCLEQLPGWRGDMTIYDKMYEKLIAEGNHINPTLKKVNKAKAKESEKYLFADILRRLENSRKGNNEITNFFSK